MLSVTLTLLEGLVVTLELFGLTLLFALPLGLVISFGSMSRCAPPAAGGQDHRVGGPGHASDAPDHGGVLRARSDV